LGSATINGTAQVKIRGTLKQAAPAGTVKFAPMKLDTFPIVEYVSNGNLVTTAVGSIEGISVDVESTALNVVRTDTTGNTTISAGSNGVSVVTLGLTSTQ
jgi:hypothetical protein